MTNTFRANSFARYIPNVCFYTTEISERRNIFVTFEYLQYM